MFLDWLRYVSVWLGIFYRDCQAREASRLRQVLCSCETWPQVYGMIRARVPGVVNPVLQPTVFLLSWRGERTNTVRTTDFRTLAAGIAFQLVARRRYRRYSVGWVTPARCQYVVVIGTNDILLAADVVPTDVATCHLFAVVSNVAEERAERYASWMFLADFR